MLLLPITTHGDQPAGILYCLRKLRCPDSTSCTKQHNHWQGTRPASHSRREVRRPDVVAGDAVGIQCSESEAPPVGKQRPAGTGQRVENFDSCDTGPWHSTASESRYCLQRQRRFTTESGGAGSAGAFPSRSGHLFFAGKASARLPDGTEAEIVCQAVAPRGRVV